MGYFINNKLIYFNSKRMGVLGIMRIIWGTNKIYIDINNIINIFRNMKKFVTNK